MSNNLVNELSLEYLMSKGQYERYLNKQTDKTDKTNTNRKDKKFYRKRILNLSRDLILNQAPDNLLVDVKYAFDNYVKTCIHYFKAIDETDIIQEDYDGICEQNKILDKLLGEESVVELQNKNDIDKLLMRSIKMNMGPLDGFVKVTNTRPPNPQIIPIQKEINLKDPELKNKGIRKKKNINNKYEENNKKINENFNEKINEKNNEKINEKINEKKS
jgi:hypothetical protein